MAPPSADAYLQQWLESLQGAPEHVALEVRGS
jgi:hypothetical protein